jgi:hypothetical protein
VSLYWNKYGIVCFSMDGKFDGTAGWFTVSGTVVGEMKQAKILMNMNIARSPKGQLSVTMDKCQTVVGKSHFTINAQGMLGTVAKQFEVCFLVLIFVSGLLEYSRARI